MRSNTAVHYLCSHLRNHAPVLFLVLSVAGVSAFAATDNLFWRESGYSFLEIAAMASLFNIGVVIAELPFAIYFDRYSNKTALQIGNLLRMAAFLIFFMNGGYGWILAGQLIAGIGYAASSGTAESLVLNRISKSMNADMVAGYSRVFFLNAIAAFVAGSVGIAAYFVMPKSIWLLATILFVLAALVILPLKDNRTTDEIIPWRDFAYGVLRVFRFSETYLLVFVNCAALAPFLLWQIRLGQDSLIFLFAGFLLMRIMSVVASPLISRLNLRPSAIYLVAAINIAIVVLFGAVENQQLVSGVFGLHVLGQSVLGILSYGLFHARVENDFRATSGSIISLMDSLLVVLVAPIVGLVADSFGFFYAMLISAIFYAIISVYARVFIRSTERSKTAT